LLLDSTLPNNHLVSYYINMKKKLLALFIVLVVIVGVYNYNKKLPAGLNYASPEFTISTEAVQLLTDITQHSDTDETQYQHEIFDTILDMIARAESFVLLDMFLFNDHLGKTSPNDIYRQLSGELTDALVSKKGASPQTEIVVVTDIMNTAYGGYWPEHFKALEEAGVKVIFTNLKALPDSNPLYSAWWRTILQWLPDVPGVKFPNVFDSEKPKIGLKAALRTLNFKANHRKIVVTDFLTDDGVRWQTLVTSLNPHDGSSGHSNSALLVQDNTFSVSAIKSEIAVVNFSNGSVSMPNIDSIAPSPEETNLTVQLLTENTIKQAVLEALKATEANDTIQLAMFYFSDRDIIKELKNALNRGVTMELLLDANKDAFGREKNGVPNRPVASELMATESSHLTVRWCYTQGEQCHSKLLLITRGNEQELILGSANFTKRNLDNFNLETNIRVVGDAEAPVLSDAQTFFTNQWNNHAVAYEVFAEDNWLKKWQYRFGEWSGLSHY